MIKRDFISAIRPRVLQATTWAYGRFHLGERPRQGLRILMYHAVGTPVEDDVRDLYNIRKDLFVTHMRYLAENYKDHLVALDATALKSPSLKIAVTFDDGFRDNLSVAAPIMVELGIPFTVFVCTGAVAQHKPGFLSAAEVRELDSLPGAAVGSHSVSHAKLSECNDRQLKEELANSKAYLQDLLGREVDTISYPHGSVDRRVRDNAEQIGYRIGSTSRFDVNRPERDPLLLCRSMIAADDDLAILEQKLKGDWDWNRWRSFDPSVKI